MTDSITIARDMRTEAQRLRDLAGHLDRVAEGQRVRDLDESSKAFRRARQELL